MSHSNLYKQPVVKKKRVFFTGTTAVLKGQGVCYDADYGTAANNAGERDYRVEACSSSNNMNFAGVSSQDYPANSAGQSIEIFEPGSVCEVSTLIATTINSTHLTALSGSGAAGLFIAAGHGGRGTCKALQTKTALASTSDYSAGVFSSSLDGSATYTASSRTITKTAAFAYVPATANLQGNEYVYVVAGATAADGTVQATVGKYLISSKTSDDAVIVSTAVAASNIDVNFYCVRGNPTVLAVLQDGEESGLTEWLNLYTDGSGTTAVTPMVGGFTRIFSGFTLGTGNAISTLADGLYAGMKKTFRMHGALTTSDYVLTVTTGIQTGVLTALATLTFDADGDLASLIWTGHAWQCWALGPAAGGPAVA